MAHTSHPASLIRGCQDRLQLAAFSNHAVRMCFQSFNQFPKHQSSLDLEAMERTQSRAAFYVAVFLPPPCSRCHFCLLTRFKCGLFPSFSEAMLTQAGRISCGLEMGLQFNLVQFNPSHKGVADNMNPFPRDRVSLRNRGTARNEAFLLFLSGAVPGHLSGRIVAEMRSPSPYPSCTSSSLTRRRGPESC